MQPENRDAGFLWDMLAPANAIRRCVGNSDEGQFGLNEQLRSAVAWLDKVLGKVKKELCLACRAYS